MIIAKISKKINRPDNFILFYLITLRTYSESITNKRLVWLVGLGWIVGWIVGWVGWWIGEKNYLFLFVNPSRSAKNVETKGITV